MTVDELRERMSGYEFMQWSVYFARKAQREDLAAKRARHQRRR